MVDQRYNRPTRKIFLQTKEKAVLAYCSLHNEPKSNFNVATVPADGIVVPPLTSIALPDFYGGRKLKRRREKVHEEGALPASRAGRHGYKCRVTRTLQGMCSITKTILGFNYTDSIVMTGFLNIPPDPHGAAGVSRLVAVGNTMIEVRQKDGTLMFREDFKSFFSDFAEASESGTFFSDPKVIYDEHEGRSTVWWFPRDFTNLAGGVQN
jgi:hypothetical protein